MRGMKGQEALVTATIKLQLCVSGDLVKALQNCQYDEADQIAKSLVEDCKDCCGLVANDMSIEDVKFRLVEE